MAQRVQQLLQGFAVRLQSLPLFNVLSAVLKTKKKKQTLLGGRDSSVVSSVPNILRPQVQILSTPTMLFSICIIEIVMRKGQI